MTSPAPAKITLVIYVDPALLKQNPTTHKIQLGNLILARKVGGVANVVFQSKTTSNFTNRNVFSWTQSLKIGASSTPPGNTTFVQAEADPVQIAPNFMCDWTGAPGNPLQYMPPAKQVDKGFTDKFPLGSGMFGTKNQPAMWYNSIWCATGDDWAPIYTDTETILGLEYRGYQVENNYQVSWETRNYTPGLFAASWSTPWSFGMQPTDTIKYLSWGHDIDASETVKWFDYGTADPKGHKPAQSGLSSSLQSLASKEDLGSIPMDLFIPSIRRPLGIRFDWTDKALSDQARRENAGTLMDYMLRSTMGYLHISNRFVGTYLSAHVQLNKATTFGDLLPGETETDKITYYLRSLVASISPRYAPSTLDWNYSAYSISSSDTLTGITDKFFSLFWKGLQQGRAALEAAASASLLQKQYRRALDDAQLRDTQIEFESVTEDPKDKTQAYTKVNFKNLPAEKINVAMLIIKDLVAKERERKDRLTEDPVVPTPDEVSVQENDTTVSMPNKDSQNSAGTQMNGHVAAPASSSEASPPPPPSGPPGPPGR